MKTSVAAISTVTLLGVLVSGASAESTRSNPTSSAHTSSFSSPSAAQQTMEEFNGSINSDPSNYLAGYVSSIDDPDTGTVTILWHGDTTKSDKIVSAGQKLGLLVQIQPARWSHEEIDEMSREAMSSIGTDANGKAGIVTYVSVDPAGTGSVILNTSTSSSIHNLSNLAILKDKKETESDFAKKWNTHITSMDNEVMPADGTRQSDWSPYNAGGLMEAANQGICSSGFGVNKGGQNYVMTARHCKDGAYHAADNSSRSYGTPFDDEGSGGSSLLPVRASGHTFDGSWSTGSEKLVKGTAFVTKGDSVCTSGGNSGTHCGAKITQAGYFNDGYGGFAVGVATVSSGMAVIQGDSGGPVYTTTSGGVNAAGLIQGYGDPWYTGSACGSVVFAGGNRCSRTVMFSLINNSLSSWNATIKTS